LLGGVERIKIICSLLKAELFRFKGHLGTNTSSLSLLEVEMYYVVAVNIHNIAAIDDISTVGDYIYREWLSIQVSHYVGCISGC